MGNTQLKPPNQIGEKFFYYSEPAIATRFLSYDEMRALGEMSNTTKYKNNVMTKANVADISGTRSRISIRPSTIDYYPHTGDVFNQKSNRTYPVKVKSYFDYNNPNALSSTRVNNPSGLQKSVRVSRLMGQVTITS
jgi:hypothetical protein